MRTRTLKTMLLLLLLAFFCAPHARAQEDEGPKLKMPCQQVLRLGLDRFVEVYGEKTQDYSTYGTKQALGYYVDCKRPVNDASARRLPPARRRQVDEAREALRKLGNAGWNMRYIIEGGGTMWGLAGVGAYAERENYMATIIAAFAGPGKQAAARQRAGASLRRAQSLLTDWSRTPKLEFAAADELAEQQKLYQESVKEAREAAAQLQTLISVLPDAAAARLASRMADELAAALTP